MAEQNNSYPMISEKNWWEIREKFKSSIPSTVSANYIKTLLSIGSDNSANSNVISPLKRVGIIDEEGKPTSLANDWRIDSKYKDVCETILNNVYPTELLDIFPDMEVDRAKARTWFMSQGVGKAAADKMVALFAMLKSGEIRERKSDSKKKSSKVERTIKKKAKEDVEIPEKDCFNEKQMRGINRPNFHIDMQIHISPDTSLEQIDAIFASMAKHLYGEGKS